MYGISSKNFNIPKQVVKVIRSSTVADVIIVGESTGVDIGLADGQSPVPLLRALTPLSVTQASGFQSEAAPEPALGGRGWGSDAGIRS